jgi:hypothetical protein
MTLIEFKQLLDDAGLPVAYSHFDSPPSIPFIVYMTQGTSNYFADNKVYRKGTPITVELYTNKKDLSAEKKLEDLLDQSEIPWEVTGEPWIESEQLFQRIYEIGVI